MLRLPMTHIGKKVGMALINAQFCDSVSVRTFMILWHRKPLTARAGTISIGENCVITRLHDSVQIFQEGQQPQFRPQ